ncbi:MAG: MBL fold metallo-hydrolase [Planctomycetota bacterium]|jgi:ribonuclease BN (tRNA processing enzyme)
MDSHARLIVLGSGTAVPRAGRATSCYLVDDGAGTVLLVDCGPGALHRAASLGYGLDRIDAILITHVHPDHCADLVSLCFALRSPGLPRRPHPILLVGHPAVGLLMARLRNAWPRWLEVGGRQLEWQPASPGPVPMPGGTTVTAHPVSHHESSLGYRMALPDGFQLAFSGDATEGAELEALGREVDLFVLEAAGPDSRPIPGHLTPRRAGRIAAACGARGLLLTHFYPAVLGTPIAEQARESFEGRLALAEDGLDLPLAR